MEPAWVSGIVTVEDRRLYIKIETIRRKNSTETHSALTYILGWPSHRWRGFKSPKWDGWNSDGAGYSLERKLVSHRWEYFDAVLTVGTCSAIS
jgi:hypothetical protein